jgi:Ca2+-binding EF-hand superfamily protein
MDLDTKYLLSQWQIADTDGSGTLSQDEVILLVKKLNIDRSHTAIVQMFQQVQAITDFKLCLITYIPR